MTEIRNILLFGRTGQGKSSVSNVLTGTNEFKESSGSVSETKECKVREFKQKIDGKEVTYRVIDTIGLGDSKLSEEDNLYELAKVANEIKDGINQVFFVTNGRFAKEEVQAFNLLCRVFFDQEVLKYSSIIRTNFPEFYDKEVCEEDIEALSNEGQVGKAVVEKIGKDKIVHVDLPSLKGRSITIETNKNIREESREKLLEHLKDKEDSYNPSNLKMINTRIKSHIYTQKIEAKKKELAELSQYLITVNDPTKKEQINKQIKELGKEVNKLIADEKVLLIRDMGKHIIETYYELGSQTPIIPIVGSALGIGVGITIAGAATGPIILSLLMGKIFGFSLK